MIPVIRHTTRLSGSFVSSTGDSFHPSGWAQRILTRPSGRDRHFGDANQYAIHEINPSEAKFIRIISNTIDEDEEVHADPKKAKNIAHLLKKKKVQVLVSKKFGANINRMKKKFVCILMNDKQISESIMILQKNFNTIITEWKKGETRKFINLKQI